MKSPRNGSRSSAKMMAAMHLVLAGKTPYASAIRMGLAVESIYRSALYKMWQRGEIAELRKVLDYTRAEPRKPRKPKRFAPSTEN